VSELVSHPRFAARRGAVRPRTWWAKAWVRAVEESAYDEADLKSARALAGSGRLGSLGVGSGRAVCVHDESLTVTLALEVLDETASAAFVEVVSAQTGHLAALLRGDLPHALVEHAEEVGVELVPFGGELAWSCGCDSWVDPCVHALALGYQLGWLLDQDPFVLLSLRGMGRAALLAALHEARPAVTSQVGSAQGDPSDITADLEAAVAASHAAQLLLDQLDQAP
jgi:uncharacterized Zn finger protein